jgi:hypothetical protein
VPVNPSGSTTTNLELPTLLPTTGATPHLMAVTGGTFAEYTLGP